MLEGGERKGERDSYLRLPLEPPLAERMRQVSRTRLGWIGHVADKKIPRMADASGGSFVYNGIDGLCVLPPCTEAGNRYQYSQARHPVGEEGSG